MKEQLFTAAETILYLAIGLILIIYPEWVDGVFLRLLGGFLLITAISTGLQFYKQYKGKKVFEEFTNQD